MKLGNIYASRGQGATKRNMTFGSLLYDLEKHKCSIALQGFRFGQFSCLPLPDVSNPPYIKGDIQIATGAYTQDGALEREYIWIGWMWTESDSRGPAYQGYLEIDPTPVFVVKHLKECAGKKFIAPSAMYLTVWLEDAERNG